MKEIFLFSLIVYSAPSLAWEVSSPATQVHLIELYSSEGCSSCPPAEKWLSELRSHPNLWKNFVPLEFHVDYWNRLGWTDPFSSDKYTARQRSYARQWKSDTVYTPGFVINGQEWRRNRKDLKKSPLKVGVLKVKSLEANSYRINFKSNKKGPFYATSALLGNGFSIQVKTGENSGKTLRHEFVVMHLMKKRLKLQRDGSYGVTATLNPKAKVKPKSRSVAFWITNRNGIPVQAIGRDI